MMTPLRSMTRMVHSSFSDILHIIGNFAIFPSELNNNLEDNR